jgi:hypothetical protein
MTVKICLAFIRRPNSRLLAENEAQFPRPPASAAVQPTSANTHPRSALCKKSRLQSADSDRKRDEIFILSTWFLNTICQDTVA